MLGVTTYQEALRALGALVDASSEREMPPLQLTEHPGGASVDLLVDGTVRTLSAGALRDVVLASRARRGAVAAGGAVSDILRSAGLALDELEATCIDVELREGVLRVGFADRGNGHGRRELHYASDDLDELRRAAAARRKGEPLHRVLILHTDAAAAAPIRELLVAEFAVQSLPTVYARAVAEAADPPDAVLAEAGGAPAAAIEAVEALRASDRTSSVPILMLGDPELGLDPARAFAAGADDVLPMPYQPAQLRARLRTWLLRARAS